MQRTTTTIALSKNCKLQLWTTEELQAIQEQKDKILNAPNWAHYQSGYTSEIHACDASPDLCWIPRRLNEKGVYHLPKRKFYPH